LAARAGPANAENVLDDDALLVPDGVTAARRVTVGATEALVGESRSISERRQLV